MYKDFKKSESLDTGFVGGSGIIWMFSGIVLGLLAGLGMYYFSNNPASTLSTADTVQQKIEAAQLSQPSALETVKASDSLRGSKAKQVSYKRQNQVQNQARKEEQRLNKFSYYAVLPTLDVPVGSARPIETRGEVISSSPEIQKKTALLSGEVEDQVIAQPKSGGYLLQVASFKKESMATRTKGHLAKRGVAAYVQKKKVRGRLWYRVVAGPVDQNSVDNWKLKAEKLGHRPLIISVR